MDSLPTHLHDSYPRDFHLADDAFYSGQLEATSRGREEYWNHWQKYSAPVGVDPYLQITNVQKRIRLLSGFAARVRRGYWLRQESEQAIMVTENKLKIAQSVVRLRPLGRRLHRPVTPILPKL